MAATRFYLDMRSKSKDGKGSIIITLAHNYTTAAFGTGVRVSPCEWNGQRVVRRADADLLNIKLSERKNHIDRELALLTLDPRFDCMTASQVKKEIDKDKPSGPRRHLISNIFNEYMETLPKESTKDIYFYTLKKVESYGGKALCIEDIDYKWLVGFNKYMLETQKVNGCSVYLRHLRAICNHAKKEKIIFDYPFDSFSIKQVETKKLFIPMDKLRELYYFPCKPNQVIYRDYFFLMFFLIGINSKDLFFARHSDVINGRLEYIREKTYKKYSIKIEPEARELLDKYCGKNYLVEVMDRCKFYKSFLRGMNKNLCQIGPTVTEEIYPEDDLFGEPVQVKRLNPILTKITTNAARHTWGTLANNEGIPMEVVSQALGHPLGSRTTMIYVKPDQKRVDEANRFLIDRFFKRI